MQKYFIYNHSSVSMSEIKPASIDLVITDPPWNMGVKFGEKVDFQPEESYQKFIENVVSNLGIVMKNEGLCVIICAEKVRHTNNTVNLPELYSKIFLNFGFNLIEAQSILLEEYGNFEWDAIPISKWDEKNSWAYSKEGKFLIFSKIREIQSTVLSKIGEKTYQSKPEEGHPCPSSLKMVNDLLNYLYSEGMNVLDPFMGTANLGVQVIKRGGIFFGYEIDTGFYETAKRKLEKASTRFKI